MGFIKTNGYPAPHIQEGAWQGFIYRLHRENDSVDTSAPEDTDQDHWFGLIDASATQNAFDSYVSNNMDSAWNTWYNNRTTAEQGHVRTSFLALTPPA